MKKHIWIAIALLAFTVGTAAAVRAEMLPAHGEGQIGLQAVILCEKLTVRQDPNAVSPAVQTLHYGDFIIVMEQTDEWAQICVSDDVDAGPIGWVSKAYIAIDPAWYRTEAQTPVYAWNDTAAPRVALLDKDVTLPVLKEDGEWIVVSLRGASGWIKIGE